MDWFIDENRGNNSLRKHPSHVDNGHLFHLRVAEIAVSQPMVFTVFGNLGHVHKQVLRGLKLGELSKTNAKRLAKLRLISAITGSASIWRQRCHVYP